MKNLIVELKIPGYKTITGDISWEVIELKLDSLLSL